MRAVDASASMPVRLVLPMRASGIKGEEQAQTQQAWTRGSGRRKSPCAGTARQIALMKIPG